jgi:hypothetical protein
MRYQFEIYQLKIIIFKIRVVVRSFLLWANTFSPFGMNRQKRILRVKYRPLINTFSPLANLYYFLSSYCRRPLLSGSAIAVRCAVAPVPPIRGCRSSAPPLMTGPSPTALALSLSPANLTRARPIQARIHCSLLSSSPLRRRNYRRPARSCLLRHHSDTHPPRHQTIQISGADCALLPSLPPLGRA